MKLEFKKIQIHSFMSFADEVFDFAAADGMTLIRGKNNDVPSSLNGSGKSNLMNSLLYVLFGQLQLKLKHIENIVNRNVSDKDMRLVLDFASDGTDYRIARGMLKGKNSYLELEKKNGETYEKITKSSIAETQDFIEKEILKCDATIFMRTIFLTADQNYNFYTLKTADKKEFVEKMFDIGVFGDMYDLIHKDLLATDKKILAGQNRAMVLGNQISDCENRSKKFVEDKNANIEKFKASVEKLQSEYDELKSKTVSVNQDAVDKLNEAVSKIDELKRKTQSDIWGLREKSQKIELAKNKLVQSSKYKKQALDGHADLAGRLCDDCRQVYLEYSGVENYESEIAKAEEDISKFDEAAEKIASQLKTLEDRNKKCDEKRGIAEQRLSSLMKESNDLRQKISDAKSRLDSARRELDMNEKSKDPYAQMLIESRANLKNETDAMEKLGAQRKYLETAQSVVSQDTLRKFVIRDMIGLLNNRIRLYLTRLGANYYVKFDDDMDFEFVPTTGKCEFGNFSAGERMRLMIATSFAFRDFMAIKNGLTSNVLILDEYFDSAIDPLCVESILGVLLEYKKSMGQNVFVISHRQEVSQDYFDRIITVEKTNGISRIAV